MEPQKKKKRLQLTQVSTSISVKPAVVQPQSQLDSLISNIEAEESKRGAKYFTPKRFELSDPEALEHLKEQGYVAFKEVISIEETKQALELMWDWLEGLGSGIKRSDSTTWTADNWPPSLAGGILPWCGIGQSAMQWYLRSRSGVQQAYANIWECPRDALITSFDGICIFRNGYETVNEKSLPLHFDQNPLTKPGKHCVQGYVNLLPTTQHTGGGTVIPESHKQFAVYLEKYRTKMEELQGEDHFIIPLDDQFITEARKGGRCVVPKLEPGDMFLWDSRTVHCSTAGTEVVSTGPQDDAAARELEAKKLGGNGLLRAVSFISMAPREKLTSETVKLQRQKAFEEEVSTSHWTTQFVNTSEYGAYEKFMTDKFRDVKLAHKPVLTPEQQRMIV